MSDDREAAWAAEPPELLGKNPVDKEANPTGKTLAASGHPGSTPVGTAAKPGVRR